jgi:glutathione S-transferase
MLAAQIGLPLERVEVDILKGESRRPDFVAKNVAGRIPVLELDDGSCMAESNAILYYLAQGTATWPTSARDQAEVLRWMFFEQNLVESAIGTARFWRKTGKDKALPEAFAHTMGIAQDGMTVLERQLTGRQWVATDSFTIADIALYSYVSVAGEAGIDLAGFPAVAAWLKRIEALPGHHTGDPA